MDGEPISQPLLITFACFSQQPTDGFLQEIVKRLGLGQENIGNGVGVVQLAMTQKLHRAHHADALLPNRFAVTGKIVKQGSVLVQKPGTEQLIARQVNQIPIVNEIGM